MKNLFVVIFILGIFSFAQAECSEEDSKIINECFNKFENLTNITDFDDGLKLGIGSKFCEFFHELQKCLRNGPECFFDADLNDMVKIFATKKEYKCLATLKMADLEKDCVQPNDCKSIKEFPACMNKILIKKCKNKKAAKILSDGTKYALEKMLPSC
uniref:Uncharacterized protein n=1 Tax=Panagrolaimus sp. PS1159 TaxID=55785 RepID=A0AC35G597_9BILA